MTPGEASARISSLEMGKIREWNADGYNGRLDNPTVANCQSPHQDPDQDRHHFLDLWATMELWPQIRK